MTPPPNMLDSANHPGVVLVFPVMEWAGVDLSLLYADVAGYNFGIVEDEA